MKLTLTLITLLAFALRAAWVLTVSAPLGGSIDYQWYYSAAHNLSTGDGLTVVYQAGVGFLPGPSGDPAVFWPPGYPLALGAVFWVFGSTAAVGEWFNVVVGTAAVPLTYVIGRRLSGQTAGLLAASFAAVYPSSIYWSAVLVSEILFTALFIGGVTVGMARPTWRRSVLLGVAIGVAAIVRPQALVLFPAWLVYLVVARHPTRICVRSLSVAVIAASFIVLPLSVWNSVRAGHAVLISSNGPYNLRIGHAPYATGHWVLPPVGDQPDFGEADYDDGARLIRASVEYAVEHPVDEVRLSANKVRILYVGDHDSITWATGSGARPIWGSRAATERLADIGDVANLLLLISVGAGILFRADSSSDQRSRRVFLYALLLSWTFLHVMFFSEPRFHQPVLPIMFALAGAGLDRSARSLLRGTSR